MTARGRSDGITKPPAQKGEAGRERSGVLAALGVGLEEVLPGLEIVDRDLEFDEGGRADLAAVDGTGRLVLVLLADEDADRATLEALDALSFAWRNVQIFVRHLAARRLDPGLEPRVVVISAAGDERLVHRLAPLLERGVELFGVRSLKSSQGERSYLVPMSASAPPRGGVSRANPEEFLAALPPPLSELGRELALRMGRLDDELVLAASPSALSWVFHGDELARVEARREALVARVAPTLEPVELRGEGDLEAVLESAMGRLVQLFGLREVAGARDPVELPGDEPEELLSQEEIEAFRD